nr:aspartic protease-like protein GME2463 [Starmerella bombicola]
MFSVFAALITLGGFVNAQGYVSMPFTKESLDTPLHKREVSGQIRNERFLYTIGFSLGNDQKQTCVLNTNSSEIWVYNSQTQAASSYNPSEAQLVSDNFNLVFRDGTKAQGALYKDKLTMDGVTVDATFGVSNTYNWDTKWGSFGIGPRAEKNSCSTAGDAETSYPFALKNAGKIEAAAYSLVMGKKDRWNGVALFGAVDATAYQGKLQLLDNQADDAIVVKFSVDGVPYTGEIDPGSAYTFLPEDIVGRLANAAHAKWDDRSKSYNVQTWSDNLTLTIRFGDIEIVLRSKELLSPNDQFGSSYTLTVKPQRDGKIILGDNFLRSAYTVYDLERNQVAIAMAASSDDNPVYWPITSAGIPGASY